MNGDATNRNVHSKEITNRLETEINEQWSKIETDKPEEEEEEEEEKIGKISEFRTVLPQVLAVTSINLILMDLGMVLAFPTIVIPELLKSKEDLRFTEEQASWFGSIAFICQPLGSLFSGLLFEPVGRRKTMLYVNFPLLVGWLLIFFGTTITYLYSAVFIMGIAIGFMDAPHITYLGEITQPKWRGILTSYAELCVALGFSLVYFLGAMLDWNTVSVLCAFVPLIAILSISRIPESPIWLLSKGRKEEAERSLCWLRGWVQSEAIQKEFANLVRYNNVISAQKEYRLCNQEPTVTLNFRQNQNFNFIKKIVHNVGLADLFRRPVFHPLLLVVAYFAFSHAAGVTSTRPFMVDILKEFGSPLDPNWVTAISSVIGILGFVTGMILLPKTGKRSLTILSIIGCGLCNGLIFIYGSFLNHLNIPLFPVTLFILLNFMWSVGIGQIPWMLISEVFPFKGRGVASGISAALSYVLAFVFTKTYYVMHNSLTLPGVMGFYGLCVTIGGMLVYYFLPETEGKTLEDIESFFKVHRKYEKTSSDV